MTITITTDPDTGYVTATDSETGLQATVGGNITPKAAEARARRDLYGMIEQRKREDAEVKPND